MRKALGILVLFVSCLGLGAVYGYGTAMAQAQEKPAEANPIPAVKITPFYVEFLELQLQQERLTTQQKELDTRKADVNARFQALLDAAKIKAEDWQIDLKTGQMTRKAPEKAAEKPAKK